MISITFEQFMFVLCRNNYWSPLTFNISETDHREIDDCYNL